MPDSIELLQQYAEERTEAAFAELVRRHIDFVYAVALRQVNGDEHLAQDVAQRVFTDLARKAGPLSQRPTLSGWLYRSTQFAAATAVRTEQRRRIREQEAQIMNELQSTAQSRAGWTEMRPELDRVMGRLSDGDRDAVMLRFFDEQPFAEIGRRLRLSENAAHMRVERALEKLRLLLARRGISSTTAALSAMLADKPNGAAPSGIAAAVTGMALSAAAGVGGLTLLRLMSSIKLQASVAVVFLATGLTTAFRQQRSNERMREEIAAFGQPVGIGVFGSAVGQVAALRAENERLTQLAAEATNLREANAGLTDARRRAEILTVRGSTAAAARASSRSSPEVFEPGLLDQQPVPVWQSRPIYPSSMVQAGSSGQVLVDYVVETDGTAGEVSATSTSDPEFAKTAVAAVQQWKFIPGQIAGQPVGTHLQIPMIFGISDDSGGTVKGFYMARTQPAPTSWF